MKDKTQELKPMPVSDEEVIRFIERIGYPNYGANGGDYFYSIRYLMQQGHLSPAINAEVKEALEFYSDEKNYHENMEVGFPFRTTNVAHDKGDKAKQALKLIAEKG